MSKLSLEETRKQEKSEPLLSVCSEFHVIITVAALWRCLSYPLSGDTPHNQKLLGEQVGLDSTWNSMPTVPREGIVL